MSREFCDTVRDLNSGEVAKELTEQFSELVAACSSTGKAGTLTLQIKLKPSKGSSKTMTVEHDVKLKAPAFDRPPDHLFVVNGNTLVAYNPEQKKLDLRDVKRDPAPLVEPSTGEILSTLAAGATQ